MITTRLSTVKSSIEVTQYVNGRRLSARDFLDERQASQAADAVVARGAGYGVIDGLTVEQQSPTGLIIHQGCGLTRSGRVIDLHKDHTIDLLYPSREIASLKRVYKSLGRTDIFADCKEPVPGGKPERPSWQGSKGFSSDPDGVYLLIARPHEVEVDDPLGALDASGCENQRLSYGVEFTSVLFFKLDSPKGGPIFRNRMAYLAFGDSWTAQRLMDPFTMPEESPLAEGIYGALEGDEDALPLALFLWKDQRIVWVDLWAGRRRVVQPGAASPNPAVGVMNASLQFEAWISDRASANGEARLYQFQDVLASHGVTCESSVLDYFWWLPPAGYLPLCLQKRKRKSSDLVEMQLKDLIQRRVLSLVSQHPNNKFDQKALVRLGEYLLGELLEDYRAHVDTDAGVLMEVFWKDYLDVNDKSCATWDNIRMLAAHEALAGITGTWRDRMIDLRMREPIVIHNMQTNALYFRVQLWHLLNEDKGLLAQVLNTGNDSDFVDRLLAHLILPLIDQQAATWAGAPPTLYAIFTRGRRQEPRLADIG